jgi:thioredoxin 1
MFMAEATFTDSNFDAEVLKASGLVMVDFFATWCGPCKMMAPTIEKLSEEYAGKVKIGKFDVDDNPEWSGKYSVQSIPTIIFFKNGEMVDQLVGFQSSEFLREKIEAHK